MEWIIILAILACGIGVLVAYRRYRVYGYSWYTGFPQPKYRVAIDSNVMVSMPDGTRLATDVYRPRKQGRYPVILLRTPYNKSGSLHAYRQLGELFASQGYVFVIQDVRGKYRSDGQFYPYAYEALDGHTTVTWAGEARWSNGRVALFGFSYPGSCAWLAARYKSPYLRTIIAMFTTQDTYSIWIDNGIPFLKGPLFWLSRFSSKKENKKVTHKGFESVLWNLPVRDLDSHTVNRRMPFYREYLAHIRPDSFWEEISAHGSDSLDIPTYIVGGWYDPFLKGTIEDYQRMTKAPLPSMNHRSRLEIGPWGHNPADKFRGVDFGRHADFNVLIVSTLKWCDIWLKEKRPVLTSTGKVRYFVMGKNEWRECEQWPPPGVTHEKYYLAIENGLADRKVGSLSMSQSPQPQESYYIYNPRDPVLFRGHSILYGDGWISPLDLDEEIVARDDVLNYTSAPLKEDTVVTGSIKLVLYVSSEALDTDFCAKICDIDANGRPHNLTAGFLRMRFRDSLENPKLMEPDAIYQVEISIRAVAHAFLKGHCIQLQVTSSDFPMHDRNLNTGLSCEHTVDVREVVQTIYTGGSYESYLLLPVLKTEPPAQNMAA